MANWCMNMVVFQGALRQTNQLEKMVQQMIKNEKKEEKGQMFPMVKADKGYLFQIEYHNGILIYLTKWQPNTEVLTAVADWLVLDYVHSYEEPAMNVYGQDTYIKGVLNEAFITIEDYSLYSFDEVKGRYCYKGELYEEVNDIYDLILAERLKNNDNPNQTKP